MLNRETHEFSFMVISFLLSSLPVIGHTRVFRTSRDHTLGTGDKSEVLDIGLLSEHADLH